MCRVFNQKYFLMLRARSLLQTSVCFWKNEGIELTNAWKFTTFGSKVIKNPTMNTSDLLYALIPAGLAAGLLLIIKYKYLNGIIRPLLYCFLLGMIAALGSWLVQYLAALLGLDDLKNLKRITFYAFVVAGGAKEFFKFMILRFYALPLKIFKGSSDGIVYALMISMGMTTMVIISYALNSVNNSQYEYYRHMLITMGIANAVFAIIMGFFVGLGKARNNRFVDSLTGLIAAAFLHGLYKFCFYTNELTLGLLAAGGSLVIAIIFIIMAMKASDREA